MARAEDVEVKIWTTDTSGKRLYGWVVTPVVRAMQMREPIVRCKECRAPVKLMSAARDGSMVAHAEHTVRFKGCSLGDCFDGKSRPNPRAFD